METQKRVSVHTLTLKYDGKEVFVDDVDEDRYSYLDLFNDSMDAFPIENGSVLTFQTGKGMFVNNDTDILRMFDSYRHEIEIPISIENHGGPLEVWSDAQNDEGWCEIIDPPQTQTQNETQTRNETQTQLETQTQIETQTETVTQAQNETQTQSRTKAKNPPKRDQVRKKQTAINSQPRYSTRKKQQVEVEDFIVSDEEYGDSDDGEFINDKGDDSGSDSDSEYEENSGSNESEDNNGTNDGLSGDDHGSSEDDDNKECSDEEYGQPNPLRGIRGVIFKGKIDAEFEFAVGLLFADMRHIREVVRDYAAKGGYDLCRIKNDKRRITVVCDGKTGAVDGVDVHDCKWRLHASMLPDKLTVKVKIVGNPHSCQRSEQHRNATPAWILEKMRDELRADPYISYKSMEEHLRKHYGVDAKQWKMYKAKARARDENEGRHAEAYAKLIPYCEMLRKLNPGTVVKFSYQDREDLDASPVFKRVFWSFGASIDGFLGGCRPFFGVDGCHLKGAKGVLLAAVSLDGNKSKFPIAFCIAEGENTESWKWFFDCLQLCIGEDNKGVPYTIMSDKQKGLIEAVAQVFPNSNHRFCTKHLYGNLKRNVGGLAIKEVFWEANRATTTHDFKVAMEKMKEISEDAYDWLMEQPCEQWSRHAYDDTSRSEHRTNNMCESFNSWILDIRGQHVLKVIDELRKKLMVSMQLRYAKGCIMEGKFTPHCKARLDKIQSGSRHVKLLPGREDNFEVLEGQNSYAVSLKEQSCTCNWWRISGFPCKHAAKAILHKRGNLEDYCNDYYYVENYLKAYSGIIKPFPTMDLQPARESDKILPPPLKRQVGRPRMHNRIRGSEEAPKTKRSNTVTCSLCKTTGHNKRGCQGGPTKAKKAAKRKNVDSSESAAKKEEEKDNSEAWKKEGYKQGHWKFIKCAGCN